MLAKTLRIEERGSDRVTMPVPFPALRGNSYSGYSPVDAASRAVKDQSPLAPASTTDRPRDTQSCSRDSDRTRSSKSCTRSSRFLKTAMDILLSAVLLALLWPVMLIIAMTIKLWSRGPVIYRSRRLGKCGRPFDCYKFRTMVPGADRLQEALRHQNERCGPFFKIAGDPRLTPLGGFLRKYSLDELPQLWNVLRGDMSLVGPRPHPVEDCVRYSSEHCQRLEVKPGVTGLWQVLARANPSFEICMLLDLVYIEEWSVLLDCGILLKTIPAVLAGEGQ
jgi:lipopolysaccharide/colanic/teichoic acid biosynthesis glycosyltransferase